MSGEPARLEHTTLGPEDAPVLVLANSLGTRWEMWDMQVEALSEHFRLVRYNHRGHGGSEVPPGPYSMADLGGDVISLLDELGVKKFSFCGLSIGGMVGMWVASEIPERIERLALVCTSPKMGTPDMWNERAETARTEGVSALKDAVLERWYTDAFHERDPEAVARTGEMLSDTPGEGYAGCCEAIRDMDLTERLGRITAPTLVVSASEDPATPPDHGEAINAAIPDSEMIVIENASHLSNIEQPEAVTSALLDHLKGGSR